MTALHLKKMGRGHVTICYDRDMAREYITAGELNGEYMATGKLYRSREDAQRFADADNAMFPELRMRVLEIDTDDLSNEQPGVRHFVQEALKFRTRTVVHRAGDKHLTAIHPLKVNEVHLNEGDKMVRIDPPRKDPAE